MIFSTAPTLIDAVDEIEFLAAESYANQLARRRAMLTPWKARRAISITMLCRKCGADYGDHSFSSSRCPTDAGFSAETFEQ